MVVSWNITLGKTLFLNTFSFKISASVISTFSTVWKDPLGYRLYKMTFLEKMAINFDNIEISCILDKGITASEFLENIEDIFPRYPH